MMTNFWVNYPFETPLITVYGKVLDMICEWESQTRLALDVTLDQEEVLGLVSWCSASLNSPFGWRGGVSGGIVGD